MSATVVTAALFLAGPSAALPQYSLADAAAEAQSSPNAAEPLAPSAPPQVPQVSTEPSPSASLPPAIDTTIPVYPNLDEPQDQGDIVVTARPRHAPGDPLQAVNVQSFAVTQAVDKAVVAPVAMTYQRALPAPVRGAIRNFFNNLAEPVAFLNFALQLKPGKAAETVGRFAINTTVGVAGMIDVAKKKPFRLPRRPNGFANTLGYYGVKPGPFLFLPVIGPTTVRDLVGLSIDRMILPTAIGQPFNQATYSIPATFVGSVDYRAEFDTQLQEMRNTQDPYAASREHYLKSRQAEIDALHGRQPMPLIDRRILPVLP